MTDKQNVIKPNSELTTNYSQVQQSIPFSLRSLVRHWTLSAMALREQLTGLNRELAKPRVHILYFHHLFTDEEEHFEKFIEKLSKTHTFISYSQAVELILSGDIDKPYIAFSSDDGFQNNMRAAEILNRFSASACFFVNPVSMNMRDEAEVETFCRDRLDFPPTSFLTWDEADQLVKQGHEIGAHTMNHINVADTPADMVEAEMRECYDILTARYGKNMHFAYPFGRFFHFNSAAMDLAFKIGFVSCATAERGCHIGNGTPIKREQLLIRRDHMVFHWPLSHLNHFMVSAAQNADIKNSFAPDSF